MQPLDLLHDKLTYVTNDAIPLLDTFNGHCDCCGRHSAEFGRKAILDKDGYGSKRRLCARCGTLFYSHPELTGLERKGKPVTFSMMVATSAVAPLEGRAILYPPAKTYDKLPVTLQDHFDIVQIKSPAERLIHACKTVKPPFVFIADFGRKGLSLAQSLRISHSLDELYVCSDSGFERQNFTASVQVASVLRTLKISQRNALLKVVVEASHGLLSPREIRDYAHNDEYFREMFATLPDDPHLKLNMVGLIRSLLKTELL